MQVIVGGNIAIVAEVAEAEAVGGAGIGPQDITLSFEVAEAVLADAAYPVFVDCFREGFAIVAAQRWMAERHIIVGPRPALLYAHGKRAEQKDPKHWLK